MTWLLLTITSAVLIAAILRLNEDRDGDRWVVAGFNYAVASILCLIVGGGIEQTSKSDAVFAIILGFGFVGGFVALMRAIKEIGLAVPATAARLSTVIPVLGSIALFDESPSTTQVVGIGVGIAAFVVLGLAQRIHNQRNAMDTSGVWMLVAVFLVSGCVDLAMKVAHEGEAAHGAFLLLVFVTAGSLCAIAAFVRRSRFRKRVRVSDVLMGCLLGVPNFSASYFLLRALEQLPGVVVFPAMNAAIVLGVTLTALVVWRERLSALTGFGLAIAACALILLGLG